MSESDTRFAFGENWRSFLSSLDAERVEEATRSLTQLLDRDSLDATTFLDIGSGSGLFSMAAVSMGARVVSLDFDDNSVECTRLLRERWMQSDPNADRSCWEVHSGSVLDDDFMRSLGTFDIVYSWGVLHHTGDMNQAISIAAERVSESGLFALAIYNDQGGGSRRWLRIKQAYHRIPTWLRAPYVAGVAGFHEVRFALARLASGRNPLPFSDWAAKRRDRGMSVWHDWVDWVGGLPFEFAPPEDIVMPLRERGFVLNRLRTVGNGWGCNEYVLEKLPDRHDQET